MIIQVFHSDPHTIPYWIQQQKRCAKKNLHCISGWESSTKDVWFFVTNARNTFPTIQQNRANMRFGRLDYFQNVWFSGYSCCFRLHDISRYFPLFPVGLIVESTFLDDWINFWLVDSLTIVRWWNHHVGCLISSNRLKPHLLWVELHHITILQYMIWLDWVMWCYIKLYMFILKIPMYPILGGHIYPFKIL